MTFPEPDQHWWLDGMGDWHVEIHHPSWPLLPGTWVPLNPPDECLGGGRLWITHRFPLGSLPDDLEAL